MEWLIFKFASILYRNPFLFFYKRIINKCVMGAIFN